MFEADSAEIHRLVLCDLACDAIQHIVDKALNRGHGSPQLMGDDRQKLCPDMIPLGQALIRGLQRFLCPLQRFMIVALLRNVFIGMDE